MFRDEVWAKSCFVFSGESLPNHNPTSPTKDKPFDNGTRTLHGRVARHNGEVASRGIARLRP